MNFKGGLGADVPVNGSASHDHRRYVDFGLNFCRVPNDEGVVALNFTLERTVDADAAIEREFPFEVGSGAEEGRNVCGSGSFGVHLPCHVAKERPGPQRRPQKGVNLWFLRRPCSTSPMLRHALFASRWLALGAFCLSASAHAADAATSADAGAPVADGKATIPAAGFGYSDHTPKAGASRPAPKAAGKKAHAVQGIVATLPGFSLREGGGTRLFVDLTQPVPVEEKKTVEKGAKEIVYVLKGAHVTLRNNTRALETVHFNTPVTRAKLVSKNKDLWLVVTLRADVVPTWKVDPGADGKGARLNIDFPDGAYLPVEAVRPAAVPGDAGVASPPGPAPGTPEE